MVVKTCMLLQMQTTISNCLPGCLIGCDGDDSQGVNDCRQMPPPPPPPKEKVDIRCSFRMPLENHRAASFCF